MIIILRTVHRCIINRNTYFVLLYVLCAADEVYIRDDKLREEYVLCEEGLMWRGSHNRQKEVMWTFGQFQKNMLESSFLLLLKIRRLALIHCSDPVKVSRNLSAAVSRNGPKTEPFFNEEKLLFFDYINIVRL